MLLNFNGSYKMLPTAAGCEIYPVVSIIISTLNDLVGLKSTINSLTLNNYPAKEIIVIDGGSSDLTVEYLKANATQVSVFISEPDSGIYDAWNKGLRVASGKYVAFLGSGDSYSEYGLISLAKCAMDNPKADFISARIEILRSNVIIRTLGEPWVWQKFRRYMNASHAGSLHSRRLFDLHGEFDTSYRIAGDYELLLRARDGLIAAYVDVTAVRMIADGASYSGYQVFNETERAKLQNQAVAPFIARIDRYAAQAKRFIRNHFVD